ncbi:MAG: hypothetical protein HN509_16890 [Halobacteriovoraceae bacterium]|mgnify:CR=1 FL=1|jgi:hypothetical protein|nr:hypothetical protein [Halobacteriovoraceae bacterium]MBT5093065.1 hypothetical protein [Halobacteriovoraceae bacterium]
MKSLLTACSILLIISSCSSSDYQNGVWREDQVSSTQSATRPVLLAQAKLSAAPKRKVSPVVTEVKEPINSEELLAVISSDYVKKTYNLSVELNSEKQIISIKTKNNKKNKIKTYKTEMLSKEITLVKALGISLISLKCLHFNPQTGCPIEIEYPYNLTYAKFKRFKAAIKKVDGRWGLYSGDRKFTKMRLVAKKFAGLLIGIKRIELH